MISTDEIVPTIEYTDTSPHKQTRMSERTKKAEYVEKNNEYIASQTKIRIKSSERTERLGRRITKPSTDPSTINVIISDATKPSMQSTINVPGTIKNAKLDDELRKTNPTERTIEKNDASLLQDKKNEVTIEKHWKNYSQNAIKTNTFISRTTGRPYRNLSTSINDSKDPKLRQDIKTESEILEPITKSSTTRISVDANKGNSKGKSNGVIQDTNKTFNPATNLMEKFSELLNRSRIGNQSNFVEYQNGSMTPNNGLALTNSLSDQDPNNENPDDTKITNTSERLLTFQSTKSTKSATTDDSIVSVPTTASGTNNWSVIKKVYHSNL